MCCPYTPVDVISLSLLGQQRHKNKLKIQPCWLPCGGWILLTGFSARPWLVSLSLLVFQCRPLAGWEGLRFVLCMLWSVQSLPAALRVEEMKEEGREEGRKGGMDGGFRRGRRANLPPTWLEASSYQMPDVRHYTWYSSAILENLKEFIALHWIRCSHSTLTCYKMMSTTSELISLKCPIWNLFSNLHTFHCYILYMIIQNNR